MLMNNNKKKKIMKLPSLFKSSADDNSTWPWPSCRQPRTLSFRTNTSAAVAAPATAATDSSDSFFTLSSESSGSLSTASDCSGGDPIERMIRGLRSDRLLFEPAGKSSSILKENENGDVSPELKEGTTVISMDSDDPFLDFRKSMEEMVEAHGMKDWERLEELLSWYLRVNGRNNHGFILTAFVDLLVSLAMTAAPSSSSSDKFVISPLVGSCCSSLCSSSSSSSNLLPCISSSMEIEEIPSLDQHHHHVFS
ncbi:transcription repressor OFP15-like [Cucurbita pepo subsp. pepo]|uniref:transcription repressor OFP15-like n=1 Tax=Cucurbita pepo subsp. pepo TaxID=3664 RepID=UPI000C9D6DBB|nr:transcription repressor OFP15-like [Cucurbita pepo subsp. pepo]